MAHRRNGLEVAEMNPPGCIVLSRTRQGCRSRPEAGCADTPWQFRKPRAAAGKRTQTRALTLVQRDRMKKWYGLP